MGALLTLDTDYVIKEEDPNNQAGIKELWVYTNNTVDSTDTIAITLNAYGMSATGFIAVESFLHATSGSIITIQAATTAVANGVLTITEVVTGNAVRCHRVIGRSRPIVWTSVASLI